MSKYQTYYENEKTKNLKFDIYGYTPPTNYQLEIDGYKTQSLGDFRTVERYKEYMETGFDILLGQNSAKYMGEDWETSDAKMVMDRAQEAGLKKVILLDERIRLLSCAEDGLVGEGKRFPTQEALDQYIADCMAPYKDHPIFYGIQLRDEPRACCFQAFKEITCAVKKTSPNAFMQCCLYPLVVLGSTNARYPDSEESGDLFDRFKAYLNAYIDATGSEYIMYDNYPFMVDKGYGTVFYRMYFRGIQIAAEVCKERNVKLAFVLQSYGMTTRGVPTHRVPSESEIFYQMNTLLGFGLKHMAYFTYWTKPINDYKGEGHPDGWAMLTRLGEKTPVYYAVQKANAMAQKLAPIILNFEYVADRYAIKTPFKTHPFHLEYTRRGKLTKITKLETDSEVALVNEMYDRERNQYLYRVQNVTYNYYEEQLGLPKQKTTLTFSSEFTKIDIFDGKEWRTEDLVNGAYTAELKAGYAEYILPY